MRTEGRAAETTVAPYMAIELARGAVLLTYRSALRQEGGGLTGHTLRSSIWLMVGGEWRLRYHQGTPASEVW